SVPRRLSIRAWSQSPRRGCQGFLLAVGQQQQVPLQPVQEHAVQGYEKADADDELEAVIGSRYGWPMRGHEGIAAASKGDGIKHQRVEQVAERHGHRGRDPPTQLAQQALEYKNI